MSKYPTVRVYFTEEGLKERFATVCFYRGRKMSEVMQDLISDWTAQQEELIEEEKRSQAPAPGRLEANLPNLIGAYLLLKYRGTKSRHVDRMASDCGLEPRQIKAVLDGQPVEIDVAGKLANVLGMSLGEFQALALEKKPLTNGCH
jgi:hypothetical protein